ncbi:recombination-associated protein RdgC [Salmonella enterica]|nr:recombination-associated protein RdgC [Salmonella enterica]EHK5999395.1 recombination-associated protein RdgC [Salmonella enterica]EIF5124614.1 recombination-associated protein RdgC [Salmonella enterica]EIF5348790.1 recombination-associated protein RdgC [Salmonella enterica]EIF5657387.1 recombination-associated protein RdgC [Salmonella enterica]
MFNKWKKISVYSLSGDCDFSEITEKCKTLPFTPCSSQSMSSFGFVSPFGEESEMMYMGGNGFRLVEAKRETKLLPAPVIKRELDKKIAKLEADQGRKLKKTEKDSLKDEVLHSLLPRAFSKFTTIQALYDGSTQRIYINAGPRQAEDMLALIRKALGSLPVVPLTMENPIELTMTEWVRSGSAPQGFTMGDSAELKAILEDGAIARLKKQDLVCDEIATHLEAGKLVTKLSLDWKDRVKLTLDDGFMLTGMKFSDQLLEQNADIDREDYYQRLDADFTLLSFELSCLTDDLIKALGGVAKR